MAPGGGWAFGGVRELGLLTTVRPLDGGIPGCRRSRAAGVRAVSGSVGESVRAISDWRGSMSGCGPPSSNREDLMPRRSELAELVAARDLLRANHDAQQSAVGAFFDTSARLAALRGEVDSVET